tara:strand:+ start:1004 stop:1744 length:741 start_codon:yes stop_codon:yes gene_type:complete
MTTTTPSKTQYVHGILDRSGSMNGKIKDVIGGLKANIEDLKTNMEENFDIFVSLKMFDQEEETLLESINVKMLSEKVIDNITKKYVPRGQTAIRDSLGNSLNHFIEKYEKEKYESCIIYVFTDGIENASKTFSVSQIKTLVSDAEMKNIKVVYVGSNQDAILSAQEFGISPGLALNYAENTETVSSAYRALSNVAYRARSGGPLDFTLPERSASCRTEQTEVNDLQILEANTLDIQSLAPPPVRRS